MLHIGTPNDNSIQQYRYNIGKIPFGKIVCVLTIIQNTNNLWMGRTFERICRGEILEGSGWEMREPCATCFFVVTLWPNPSYYILKVHKKCSKKEGPLLSHFQSPFQFPLDSTHISFLYLIFFQRKFLWPFDRKVEMGIKNILLSFWCIYFFFWSGLASSFLSIDKICTYNQNQLTRNHAGQKRNLSFYS